MTDAADPASATEPTSEISGHGGVHALTVARAHGVETVFTLSGAHVFPVYDAAVTADPPTRLLDVRHEQTATFAAEATGKLTRRPGLAVLTAGPGVTNGVSAIAQASFSGAPMVVIGGRSPDNRWGQGALQEFDHVAVVSPMTRYAATAHSAGEIAERTHEAFTVAASPHRGPAFLDVPLDHFFDSAAVANPFPPGGSAPSIETRLPNPEHLARIADLLADASHPILVLGSDVWADGAEEAALRLVEDWRIPTLTNGQGRGVLPGGHPLLVTKARGTALNNADLVVVVGTPLDFRLGYGLFGGKDGAPLARTVHIADSPGQLATHLTLAGSAAGDLTSALDGIREALERKATRPDWSAWAATLADHVAASAARDSALLTAEADPIHPARIYGELLPRLAEDAVVIGDGGDFVSFAGKFVEPQRPGCWLDPGPFGCLGAGIGAAIAARISRPDSQVVLLLGDGAAGFALSDIDTLVRHRLPVVMVMGNNSAWALEKGPMQMLYGYDVIADLAPRTRYDQVATALGAGGEMVTDPREIGPALDRALASGIPYLVNIVTDVTAAYPRNTLGI